MYEELQKVRYGRIRSSFTVAFAEGEREKEVYYSHLNPRSLVIMEPHPDSVYNEVQFSKDFRPEVKTITFIRKEPNTPERTYGYLVLGE